MAGPTDRELEELWAAIELSEATGYSDIGVKRWTLTSILAAYEEQRKGWQPIETAPKDGTPILAFCVHLNARLAGEDVAEWTEIVTTRWIDFNGGGWTWNGICGVHTHWMPLPSPPSEGSQADARREGPHRQEDGD